MSDRLIHVARSAFRALYHGVAALGFLLLFVTVTPLLTYWTDALSAPWGNEKGDVMILLGAGATAPDIISLGSYWRSVHAVTLWRAEHFSRVIITGREEAPLMRDFLVLNGIPASAITIEGRSNSTRENALFAAEVPGASGARRAGDK